MIAIVLCYCNGEVSLIILNFLLYIYTFLKDVEPEDFNWTTLVRKERRGVNI